MSMNEYVPRISAINNINLFYLYTCLLSSHLRFLKICDGVMLCRTEVYNLNEST